MSKDARVGNAIVGQAQVGVIDDGDTGAKKDPLERIADALDGGGDYNQGKPDEVGYLDRIANYLEENPGGGGGSGGGSSIYFVDYQENSDTSEITCNKTPAEIATAIQQNNILIARINHAAISGNDADTFLYLQNYYYNGTETNANFLWVGFSLSVATEEPEFSCDILKDDTLYNDRTILHGGMTLAEKTT